jgi:N-acetylmuramic acid 6-phosphate etherase
LSNASFDPRITEHRNPRSTAIDLATPLEIVDTMGAEDAQLAAAVSAQRENIAQTIQLVEAAFRRGGRLIYVGAGTSGRLGVLDAAECPPTFGTDPSMVVGVIAGGQGALTAAVEGAEDNRAAGGAAIDDLKVGSDDVVVGIAASGTTPFVRSAILRARERGARTALLTCTPPDDGILAHVDVAIVPVAGPEVVTGSTRLKAGTATKMVLNMLTTGAMIRIGKTLGNLMVDLRATNAKLTDRSQRILMEVCGVSREQSVSLLAESGGRVKTAIAMHYMHVDRDRAEEMLEAAGGVLRRVIGSAADTHTPGT